MAELSSHALIVGCGFLGRVVASKLIERGITVLGTTRHSKRAEELAGMGVKPLIVSVTQPLSFAALRPALEAPSLDVFYLVPPGRPGQSPSPRQVVLGGIAHVLKQLRSASVRRAVLASSTAVYAQREGQRVDADSLANPSDERGKLLQGGEQLWLDDDQWASEATQSETGADPPADSPGLGDLSDTPSSPDPSEPANPRHFVLRLAGLYGPERVIGLRQVAAGSPIVGNAQALVNLIHVDDAANLLLAVMQAEYPGRIELGCDGHPVQRQAYYRHLAELLGKPAPQVLDDESAAQQLGLDAARLRRVSSKALDNIPTCRRTGWAPRYASYRQGVEAAIGASRTSDD